MACGEAMAGERMAWDSGRVRGTLEAVRAGGRGGLKERHTERRRGRVSREGLRAHLGLGRLVPVVGDLLKGMIRAVNTRGGGVR